MTTTDVQGRFEIAELVGGRDALSVSKAGYVTMSYGQRRPEQQGTTLEILDGQMVEKITFSLPRGGVITGRVTDEFGDPIAGAQVNALRYRYKPLTSAPSHRCGLLKSASLVHWDCRYSNSTGSDEELQHPR